MLFEWQAGFVSIDKIKDKLSVEKALHFLCLGGRNN